MSSAVLQTRGLTRSFGRFEALRGVDLCVEQGDLYGFLGQNGAGKTTTIRILAGLVRPGEGEVSLLGRDLRTTRRRDLFRSIGFLVEAPSFFPYLSGLDNLLLHARLLDLPDSRRECQRLLDEFGLTESARRRTREYSLGMKQRLGLAQALLGSPELLILDEPTNGLDPNGIAMVREILFREVRESGRTIFLSSHLLTEVESSCNRVAVIDRGRVIAQGEVNHLLKEGESVRLRTSDPAAARGVLGELEMEVHAGAEEELLIHGDDEQVARVVRGLIEAGIDVHEVTRQRRSLEDVYQDLTAGGTAWQES